MSDREYKIYFVENGEKTEINSSQIDRENLNLENIRVSFDGNEKLSSLPEAYTEEGFLIPELIYDKEKALYILSNDYEDEELGSYAESSQKQLDLINSDDLLGSLFKLMGSLISDMPPLLGEKNLTSADLRQTDASISKYLKLSDTFGSSKDGISGLEAFFMSVISSTSASNLSKDYDFAANFSNPDISGVNSFIETITRIVEPMLNPGSKAEALASAAKLVYETERKDSEINQSFQRSYETVEQTSETQTKPNKDFGIG